MILQTEEQYYDAIKEYEDLERRLGNLTDQEIHSMRVLSELLMDYDLRNIIYFENND